MRACGKRRVRRRAHGIVLPLAPEDDKPAVFVLAEQRGRVTVGRRCSRSKRILLLPGKHQARVCRACAHAREKLRDFMGWVIIPSTPSLRYRNHLIYLSIYRLSHRLYRIIYPSDRLTPLPLPLPLPPSLVERGCSTHQSATRSNTGRGGRGGRGLVRVRVGALALSLLRQLIPAAAELTGLHDEPCHHQEHLNGQRPAESATVQAALEHTSTPSGQASPSGLPSQPEPPGAAC